MKENVIVRSIPNVLTICNLLSGCGAMVAAFSGSFDEALGWIVLGCVFDFFDGFAARLLGVSSRLGVELDSLADVVTSGVAPATMLYAFLSEHVDGRGCEWVPYLSFLLAAFAAYRLSKFNIDERQHAGFLGLPTPANALFWAALTVTLSVWLRPGEALQGWLLAGLLLLVVVACVLMVCERPMMALKFKNWSFRENKLRYLFLLGALALLLLFGVLGLACSVVWYVSLSVTLYRQPKNCER